MKLIFKILVIALFFALIALGLISCGARNVKKEASKEEIKSELNDHSVTEKQAESNIKTTTTTKVDDKDESITSEETFEPVDPTKEASIIDSNGKKTILNNSKKKVKTETKKNNTATSKEILQVETKKEAIKEQKSVKHINASKKENTSKEVVKKQFNWLSLWPIYLILAVVLYFFRKSIPILKLIP